jgi:hypothetical protein
MTQEHQPLPSERSMHPFDALRSHGITYVSLKRMGCMPSQ